MKKFILLNKHVLKLMELALDKSGSKISMVKSSIRDSITVENDLEIAMLWYNDAEKSTHSVSMGFSALEKL